MMAKCLQVWTAKSAQRTATAITLLLCASSEELLTGGMVAPREQLNIGTLGMAFVKYAARRWPCDGVVMAL